VTEQTGWWTFDAETQALINRVSGQRICFESAVDDAGSLLQSPATGPARFRFFYEDAEVRYPVTVTARRETYGGPGFDHGDSRRLSLSWSVDHLASAVEWRRSCDVEAEIPPYGLWRRVDDALFDALACWPSNERSGLAPSRIDAWGGWLNGVWTPRLRRVGAGRAEQNMAVESGLQPFLEPLASPPLSWHFVDAERAVACASLAGIRTLRTGRHFLPRGAALAGFDTAIPHLRRSDGKAVMFPYGIRSSRDKDGYYTAGTQFFYADEDVFFRLDGRGFSSAWDTGTWEFELDELIDLGVRQDDPDAIELPAGLICSRKVYDWRGPYLQPLPRLAQRLTAALIDGWLGWSGSSQRLLDDPKQLALLASEGSPHPVPALAKSGIDLNARGLVRVNFGYHGGRFVAHTMTGYLQQDGWTEAGCPLPWLRASTSVAI
jgi:hypothetical protein